MVYWYNREHNGNGGKEYFQRGLLEERRVTKNGGILLLFVYPEHLLDNDFLPFMGLSDVHLMLTHAGFKQITELYIPDDSVGLLVNKNYTNVRAESILPQGEQSLVEFKAGKPSQNVFICQ